MSEKARRRRLSYRTEADDGLLTVESFCETLAIDVTVYERWRARTWVAPMGAPHGRTVLTERDLARGRLLLDLERDLALEEDAVDVIVHLIDQIHGLRSVVAGLSSALAEEPDAVRRRILTRLAQRRHGARKQ